MIIKNKDFASNLMALMIMCAEEDTDNCDVTLTTSKGEFICHIEFSKVEKEIEQ